MIKADRRMPGVSSKISINKSWVDINQPHKVAKRGLLLNTIARSAEVLFQSRGRLWAIAGKPPEVFSSGFRLRVVLEKLS